MNWAPKDLRVALIGTGRMGAFTDDNTRAVLSPHWFPLCHAEAIQAETGLELVALCDTNHDQLHAASRRYNVSRTYSDFRELITEVQPDLLAVATRTAGRCEILEFAAEHGVRGVHVEKPLGNNMEEVRRALAAVSRNRTKLTYGAGRRYLEMYRRAKQMVMDGAIGTVSEIRISFGRTLLMWNHPHSIDLMLYFNNASTFLDVQASCRIPSDAISGIIVDADPLVEWGVVRFSNGVNGTLSSVLGFTVDIAGDKGILSVIGDGNRLERMEMLSSGYLSEPVRIKVAAGMSGTQRAFHELARAVRGQSADVMSVEELLCSQAILFSLVRSSMLAGRRVDSSMIDDHFTVTGRWGQKYA